MLLFDVKTLCPFLPETLWKGDVEMFPDFALTAHKRHDKG
jgi:hypothetical protein